VALAPGSLALGGELVDRRPDRPGLARDAPPSPAALGQDDRDHRLGVDALVRPDPRLFQAVSRGLPATAHPRAASPGGDLVVPIPIQPLGRWLSVARAAARWGADGGGAARPPAPGAPTVDLDTMGWTRTGVGADSLLVAGSSQPVRRGESASHGERRVPGRDARCVRDSQLGGCPDLRSKRGSDGSNTQRAHHRETKAGLQPGARVDEFEPQ